MYLSSSHYRQADANSWRDVRRAQGAPRAISSSKSCQRSASCIGTTHLEIPSSLLSCYCHQQVFETCSRVALAVRVVPRLDCRNRGSSEGLSWFHSFGFVYIYIFFGNFVFFFFVCIYVFCWFLCIVLSDLELKTNSSHYLNDGNMNFGFTEARMNLLTKLKNSTAFRFGKKNNLSVWRCSNIYFFLMVP